jgi:hypothetical protein
MSNNVQVYPIELGLIAKYDTSMEINYVSSIAAKALQLILK